MKVKFLVLPLVAVLANCGALSKKNNSNDSDSGANYGPTGCVQGFVEDGLTGQPVLLQNASREKEEGIMVLVQNNTISASLSVDPNSEKAAEKKLVGEYHVCGIPLDEEFPIFVWVKGYQSFQSTVKIDSTIKPKATEATQDLRRTHPTVLANVRLYPVGANAANLQFKVTAEKKIVNGARVDLVAAGRNRLDSSVKANADEAYLTAHITRMRTLSVTTNDKGEATFEGKDLVMGGLYEYRVVAPESNTVLDIAKGNLVIGTQTKSGPNLKDTPFIVDVALQPAPKPQP